MKISEDVALQFYNLNLYNACKQHHEETVDELEKKFLETQMKIMKTTYLLMFDEDLIRTSDDVLKIRRSLGTREACTLNNNYTEDSLMLFIRLNFADTDLRLRRREWLPLQTDKLTFMYEVISQDTVIEQFTYFRGEFQPRAENYLQEMIIKYNATIDEFLG